MNKASQSREMGNRGQGITMWPLRQPGEMGAGEGRVLEQVTGDLGSCPDSAI